MFISNDLHFPAATPTVSCRDQHLQHAHAAPGNISARIAYTYDGYSGRVLKREYRTIGGVEKTVEYVGFIYDGWNHVMTVRLNETNTPRGRVASYVSGPDVGSSYGEKPRGVGGVLDGRGAATEARRVSGRAEPANQYAGHQKAGGVGGLCMVLDGANTNTDYPDSGVSNPDPTDDDYFP